MSEKKCGLSNPELIVQLHHWIANNLRMNIVPELSSHSWLLIVVVFGTLPESVYVPDNRMAYAVVSLTSRHGEVS